MYKMTCDGFPILDVRDDDLIVFSPKIKLEVNTIGSGSFTIYENHPYFHRLRRLKSVFEVYDEIGVIFRGRMTNDTIDFENGKSVDLEGAMGYFNDSQVKPFSFPEDFEQDEEYIDASENGNVVKFLLKWFIDQHNAQVQDFQKFKLGEVTVSDPNNYITRSSSNYDSTWKMLDSKLFGSALGGYLCIRYEDDGNYIDYLSDFELTNVQKIVFGENLLDLSNETDATETYSAIIPIGKEVETTDEEGNVTKTLTTISEIEDGELLEHDDIVKSGNMLYSKTAVENYGFICAPVSETTWSDVTVAENLLNKGVEFLLTDGVMLKNTIEVTAVDLHFTDDEIQSFRIYRNVEVESIPHGLSEIYQLPKLEIPLLEPQNTKITIGKTQLTLVDKNKKDQADSIVKIESAIKDIEENRTNIEKTTNHLIVLNTEVLNTCEEVLFSALQSYVETSDYDLFKETVQAQLSIMAEEIAMKFVKTNEQITNVDGDLQKKFVELYKYISFNENGITIGSNENGISLNLDNDRIVFSKNGVEFGYWNGNYFHTGNILVDVDEKAQFGNFAYVPRTDGSLSFLKVGG